MRNADLTNSSLHPPSRFRQGGFTVRGVLFLAASLYLIIAPGLHHADIIASVIGVFFSLLLFLIVAATVLQGLVMKRTLSISFALSSEENPEMEDCFAGVPYASSLRISARRIFPYFHLRVTPIFEHAEFVPPTIIVTGSDHTPAFVPFEVLFPHRGLWRILSLRCILRDQFGITVFTWNIPTPHVIRVAPAPILASNVPVMSSSHRSGDLAVDVTHRQGDPFDLKRYHPSDGMKKILWKVYAKSRELLSRHPEASFTPEGQVALYVVAGKDEDGACSEAIAYMKRLEEQDLELYLSASTFRNFQPARNSEEALERLIETCWDEEPIVPSLQRFIKAVQRHLGEAKLDRLIFFVTESRLENRERFDELLDASNSLVSERIAPVFVLSGGRIISIKRDARASARSVYRQVRELFLDEAATNGARAAAFRDEFMTACLRNNWELIVA